jgi:hypothetical protein
VGLKTSEPRITIITASLPERSHLLAELTASVAAQNVMPAAHLIVIEDGPIVPKLKRLQEMVDTEYWCQVDDDDILYPNHIEVLSQNLVADVVWTWCDVTGRNWNPNSGYMPGLLQHRNYIPCVYAGRKSKAMEVGGFMDYSLGDYQDWNLLRRLESGGATFHTVPTITWNYRFGLCKQISGRPPVDC